VTDRATNKSLQGTGKMPGVTQPAPSYQQYRPLPPMMGVAAPPKQSSGGLTSMLAGILALVTAGLAVGGSFAPITTFRNTFEGGGDTTVTASDSGWWGFADAGSSSPFESRSLLFGLTLVLVAALLVLGAVFAFVASRTRTPGPTAGGRSLISAGVGVLAGVMLLESLQVLDSASSYNDRDLEAGESLEFSPGLGLVLPLSALGLGVIAVVLAHVGQRQRQFRQEPSTPRMGFPAPYGYQPGAPAAVGAQPQVAPPAERPTDVQVGSQAESGEIDESSEETTQVVSSATVSEQDTGETPAAVTPPAPVAPPAGNPTVPGAASAAAAASAASPAEGLGEPAPATPAAPVSSEAPAAPAAPAPEAPAAQPATQDVPEAPSADPTPLTDLPAAPPAPELSDEADKDKK
jgi:hypothetical protein